MSHIQISRKEKNLSSNYSKYSAIIYNPNHINDQTLKEFLQLLEKHVIYAAKNY